ncbi:hypothetical protein ABPG74_015606 [Tetrahymena malaccensis]
MGGSPSKKNEIDQNNQYYTKGGQLANEAKERSVSLPTHSQHYSTMNNSYQIKQIVPIKAHNRSATISYSQPHQYSITQKIPNIQKSNQKTVFTDFYDSQSASQVKSIITNLDNSMIDYQNKISTQNQQDQILEQQNQISSRLRVTLAAYQGQNQQQQQVPYIAQAQVQRSQLATPQKQVPRIIQNSAGSIDKSSRMSPYQLLRNVVIYENNSSFNSNNNNNSANKGITVTSKPNNQIPQIQQFTSIASNNKQIHAINASNQPKILTSYPQFQESEQQSTIRTTISQNLPIENIKVVDFLQKNKIPQNHICVNPDNMSAVSSLQDCSCIFTLKNHSDIQQKNIQSQKDSNFQQQLDGKQVTGNILVVDRNTARQSSAHNTSQMRDESCFNESPEYKKQNTSISLVNQQRSIDFEQKDLEKVDKNQQVSHENISSAKQNNIKEQNQVIQSNSTNRTQITSNQTSSTKQENVSNEQTQKKKLNSNGQNENYLIQLETEKKIKEQQTNQFYNNSQQKSKINLSSPQIHKKDEKSYGKNMDDQVSLMYSATEDQKKSGNSAFLLMNSGNNQQGKNNYTFISANKDQSIHNNSQTVFQNSQLYSNSNNQTIYNQRSNNFLSKQNQNNERQLIVKLEDLYKQMDAQSVSQDSLLRQNQNLADQQIRVIPHPTECNTQIQRSFSHISSLSVFRASNEKLKEDKSCDSYTLQSDKKDLSNKNLILNTSVTQLPTIQKYYYPVTSVKKVKINKESIPLQQQIQPYLVNTNQRSQSINQSTQFTDSFYQYSNGQKLQRDNYFSVDSQRNGGILLLKDNQNFQALNDIQQLQSKQICLTEHPVMKFVPLSNSLSSNQKQIQEPSFLRLSQQIPNAQALQPKQQIKIDAKFQVAQNQIMQQKPIQQVNPNQIQALKQILETNQQNGQIQITNKFGIKQIKADQIQNESDSPLISQKELNGQNSIIQSCELNNIQIKEQEFSKEMSNSQISHASISIIPRSIDAQDCTQGKLNNKIIHNTFNQQQKQQPVEHFSQKHQFETNTQKPKQKDLNHSSMDSFAATSSYANYQSSSCDEYKHVKKDCNNKVKDKEELKQTSLQSKNTVRTSDIKQDQNSSFRQQQHQQQQIQQSEPIQVNINLQEQIQNKLQREINLNSINLQQKVSSNDDKKQHTNSIQIKKKEDNLKLQQQVSGNQNNYSFQYNSNNISSVNNNNNNNTTFDFQLTRTDDEYIQNQLLTVIDEDNKQQHLLKSAPKKKLNPEDKIQIYLNFSSENSDYSSVLSECNEKLSNFTPFPAKEVSFTRQLKNPLVYDKGVQVDQFNKENNLISGMNINVSLENQVKQNQQKNIVNNFQNQKQNKTLPRGKQQSTKNNTQSINKQQKSPIESTNEFQINKIIQNELNSATQDSYPSDQNIKVSSKMNGLMLLEAQDICKKTLITYQNIIDLEDQRKSPKEFDRDFSESLNSNLNPKKRFLTQNDQEEEESLNNYREAQNSMQSQSINSNNGIAGNQSTPFNFSKQQIFSSVNSYNLQNSTILRKVNNQFQALTSFSQNNNTDNEKEHLQYQLKNIMDMGDNEIFFKYCKKSGTLVPIPQSKISEILQEKSQNTLKDQYQQTQSNKKLFNNTSLNLDQPCNVNQEKRSQSNMPVEKKQNANFNNLYNNQYLFSKNNSNLYTDVLERYSGFINKKAREQKSKIQQNYQSLHNSKQSSSTNRSRQKQNLRV